MPTRVLPNALVSAAGVAVFPPKATFGPRTLMDFEFVWMIEGEAVAHFDGQRVAAPPGTILLGRPGMTDQYDWDVHRRTVHGYFHFSLRETHRWPPCRQWPLARPMPEDDVLRPLFRYVLRLASERGGGDPTPLSSVIEVMLDAFVGGNLMLAPEPALSLPQAVERALQAIHDAVYSNPPSNLRLTELAAAASVTRQHLCRLFRQHLQLGPMETVRLIRLQHAATLLSRSTLSVKEVSDAAGFASPYHFSRAFRAVYSLSPQQYRSALWSGQPTRSNPLVGRLRWATLTLGVGRPMTAPVKPVENPPTSETPAPKSSGR